MNSKPKIATILYATDLGGQTRPVFRYALAMAKEYDAKIIMLHVVEPMSESAKAVISSYLSKELTDEVQKETMREILVKMRERLDKFYKDEGEDSKQSSHIKEVLVMTGSPSEEILRISDESNVDMIVIGKSTRKVRGIRVMGSTARRVSRMSNKPVLIVPNY